VAVVKAQIPENLKGSQNIETTSAFYILQASAAASATVEVALVADSLASNDGFVAAAPEGHFCALRYGAVACYLQARPKQSALSGDSDDSGEVHASIEDQTLVKLQLCAVTDDVAIPLNRDDFCNLVLASEPKGSIGARAGEMLKSIGSFC